MARTNVTTVLPGLEQFTAGRSLAHDSRALQIDYSTLYLLVKCKRGASLDMALRLARFYGTNVEVLTATPVATAGLDC